MATQAPTTITHKMTMLLMAMNMLVWYPTAMKRLLIIALLAASSLLAADVTGKWSFAIELDAGSGAPTFEFQQQGESLTGTYTGMLGTAPLKGAVKGGNISFSFEAEYSGEKLHVVYEGVVESASKMKGTVKLGTLGSGTFTASKK